MPAEVHVNGAFASWSSSAFQFARERAGASDYATHWFRCGPGEGRHSRPQAQPWTDLDEALLPLSAGEGTDRCGPNDPAGSAAQGPTATRGSATGDWPTTPRGFTAQGPTTAAGLPAAVAVPLTSAARSASTGLPPTIPDTDHDLGPHNNVIADITSGAGTHLTVITVPLSEAHAALDPPPGLVEQPGVRRVGPDGGVEWLIGARGELVGLDPHTRCAVRFALETTHPTDRAAPLRDVLVWAARLDGACLLHGAAIGAGDRAVLVLGRGGTGKSTVTVEALVAGLRAAGDDYVWVAPGNSRADPGRLLPNRNSNSNSYTVHPVYRTVKVGPLAKEQRAWLGRNSRASFPTTDGRAAHVVTADHFASAPLAVEGIVVLRPPELPEGAAGSPVPLAEQPTPRVSAGSAADVMHSAGVSTVSQQQQARRTTLAFVAELGRSLPVGVLTTGGPGETLRSITTLLGQWSAAARSNLSQVLALPTAATATAPPVAAAPADESDAAERFSPTRATTWRTPIALFVFNRPEHTRKVMERIRAAKPPTLLVVADGPRNAAEAGVCEQVRLIATDVDDEFEVRTLFAEQNMGCRDRIVTGLDWVFHEVPEAIVLEDDCLPDPTFFPYCAELLDRYREDRSVMTIGGHRWEGPDLPEGDSYYFSRFPATWGWATWADRWCHFDASLRAWERLRTTHWLREHLGDDRAWAYWHRVFDATRSGMDAWDYSWTFACWLQGGLALRPNVNMIHNIGFGADATHTFADSHPAARRESSAIRFPLRHPAAIAADAEVDLRLERLNHSGTVSALMHEARRRAAEQRERRAAEHR